jgi:hypothetical protein
MLPRRKNARRAVAGRDAMEKGPPFSLRALEPDVAQMRSGK